MNVEKISQSISTKVWDPAGIKLIISGTLPIDCAMYIYTGPSCWVYSQKFNFTAMSQLKDITQLAGLQKRVGTGTLIFLFLYQNMCCGYSKEPPQ